MKKLLIVSYSYPPSNAPAAQRPYSIAKYISNHQVKPVVLTSKFGISSMGSSETQLQKDDWDVVYCGKQQLNIIKSSQTERKVNLIKTLITKFLKFITPHIIIPDRGILWYKAALKEGRAYLSSNPDVKYILSTSPSVANHLVAKKLKKEFDLYWISDFRDFYYVKNLQFSRKIFRKYIDKVIEKSIIKRADHHTFVTDTMGEDYVNHYNIREENKTIIYNGLNKVDYTNTPKIDFNDNKIRIFYGGSFYNGVRSPFPLLDVITKLIDNKDLEIQDVEIIIAGTMSEKIREQIASYKLDVRFLGLISKIEVLKYILSVDFLWLIVGDIDSHNRTIPLKLFEYLGSKKSIICSSNINSESAKLLADYDCHFILNINETNIDRTANLFLKFINRMHNSINDFDIDKKYFRSYQAEQFSKLLVNKNDFIA